MSRSLATAITPMAFYETVMARSYETLVDPATKVDVHAGMVAAGRLQALLDSRADRPDPARMLAELNRVIEAVRSTVPRPMWAQIVRKLDHTDREPLDVDTDGLDEADDGFDPTEFAEGDDEL